MTDKLACNECGEPLEVPQSVRYLTCARCGAKLEAHRGASAGYTTTVSASSASPRPGSDDLEALHLRVDLEKLEREWGEVRDELIVRYQDGTPYSAPTMKQVWILRGLGVFFLLGGFIGFPIVMYGTLSGMGEADQTQRAISMQLFVTSYLIVCVTSFFLMLVCLWQASRHRKKAQRWNAEETAYLARRQELQSRLARATGTKK